MPSSSKLRRRWSRVLGVSQEQLVETVRRMGGTPTVERVRNALLGRDRDPASRGTRRASTGARGGRGGPLGASRGSSRAGRDLGFVLR